MRGTCGKYLRKSPNQNGNRNTRRNNEDIDQPGKKKKNIYIYIIVVTVFTVITTNINGLYSPVKRHRVAGWVEKQVHAASRPRL